MQAAQARVILRAIAPQEPRLTAEETTRVVLGTRVLRAGPPIVVKMAEATAQETPAETVVATSLETAPVIPVAIGAEIKVEIKAVIAEQTTPGTAEARVTVLFPDAQSL